MSSIRRCCIALLCMLEVLLCHAALAEQQPALLDVAHLWRDIHYLHPALADGSIKWDEALAKQLPALADATDDESLRTELSSLLQVLRDPSLRIWTARDDTFIQWRPEQSLIEWLDSSTVLLHLHAGITVSEDQWRTAMSDLRGARKLIVDLRATAPTQEPLSSRLRDLAARFIAAPLQLPAEQFRFSAATRAYGDWDSPDLHAGLITLEALRLSPAPDARPIPMVFLVSAPFKIPPEVLALQHVGIARIVEQRKGAAAHAEPTTLRRIGNSIWVEFATGRLLFPAGAATYQPDRVLPAEHITGAGSAAVGAARQMLARPWKRVKPQSERVGQLIAVVVDAPEDKTRLPPPGWRMMAAVKLWATMDQQHPARYLLGNGWDAALVRALESVRKASNELEYGLALQTMAAAAGDSHVKIWSRALNTYRGRGDLGIQLSLVEGRVIITGLNGASDDTRRALAVGDEIIAVDRQSVVSRMAEIERTLASSTGAGAVRSGLQQLLRGPEAQSAVLTVVDTKETREVALPRSRYDGELPQRPAAQAVRWLDARHVYVDLDLLQYDAVTAMLDEIERSEGVIFDLRGYPHGTAWTIAARLNVRGAKYGPVIHAPFVSTHAFLSGPLKLSYAEPLRATKESIYRGKVVVLIDDRTISQAEHTALMLEASTPVTFVGSTSAGSNGDLRHIVLPGRVTVSYSGYEITHADGTRLQRIGLQPHIPVKPTVAGIRAGRDEVLERALSFLQQGQ
ncbi:S41 family peptidase [Undibacterium rugosum]|uniref:S41 family peptidase n=1 Tax=Undibacterium rugosum TaxID=2762291 RepID=UPI001B81AB53|nr:S41 family peptidase [Undibacterium rugosum]MBR7780369.1 hypothetical protein [Undibacterium rugosum]